MSTPGIRFYYGWVIVALGFCTVLLVQGSFASSGVLFAALTKEYGWSRATAGALSYRRRLSHDRYVSLREVCGVLRHRSCGTGHFLIGRVLDRTALHPVPG